MTTKDQGRIRRYLLGEAPPEERVELEDAYLADSTLFEELTEAENDLIDAYVRGQLPEQAKKAFEHQFLASPQRRARVQFASALNELSQELGPGPSIDRSFLWRWFNFSQWIPMLRWSMALGALAIILAVGWLKVNHDRAPQASLQPPQSGEHQSPSFATPPAKGQAPSGQNDGSTEVARTEIPELTEFTMRLKPGLSRSAGAETKTFALPKADRIDLQLTLDNDDYPAYVAELETAEGKLIRRIDGLKSRSLGGNQVIDLRFSSHLIRAGDYVVTLSGISAHTNSDEEVEVYSFRAAR